MQKPTASAVSSMLVTAIFCQVFTLPHVVADVRAPHEMLWDTEANEGSPPQRLFDPPPEEVNLIQKNLDVDSHMAKTNQSGFDWLAGVTDEVEEQEGDSKEQEKTKDEVDEKMDDFETFFQEKTKDEVDGKMDDFEKQIQENSEEGSQCIPSPMFHVAFKGGRSGKFCSDEGSSIITCKDDHISSKSEFTLYNCRHWGLAIQGKRFGKYCLDTKEGIICDQDSPQKLTTFQFVTQQGGGRGYMRMALKGKRSGQYCAEEEAGVICDRDWVRGWEIFNMKQLGAFR